MIRENQKVLNRVQIILDSLIVVAALLFAYIIRFWYYDGPHLEFSSYIPTLMILVPMNFIIYNVFRLYEPKRRQSLTIEISKVIQANLLSMAMLLSLLYIIKEMHYSRQVLMLFVIITFFLSMLERIILRIILRSLREKGFNKKYVLVIGSGRLGKMLAIKLQENKYLGYEIVGFIDDSISIGKTVKGIKVIGSISDLENTIAHYKVDEIFITISMKEYDKFGFIINVCEKSGVRTQIVPDYARYIPARPFIDDLDGIPLINIRHVPLDNFIKAYLKRTVDLVLSILGLAISIPLFVVIAIAIKIDSPGPVFFSQERVGLKKVSFKMYKFRTMKVQTKTSSNNLWTTKDDSRKTRLGKFLRRTSIDELPQLLNVIIGDMSLVGPRPERPFYVKQFKEKVPKYMIKHHVRPGITGWAQINGWRGDTSIRKRIEHDIYYIENWTFMFDLKILLLTVFENFVNKNAY